MSECAAVLVARHHLSWRCFWVLDLLTPYELWKEIVEEKNIALAILVAAMCLGDRRDHRVGGTWLKPLYFDRVTAHEHRPVALGFPRRLLRAGL